VRLVPSHKQTGNGNDALTPAKWPLKIFFVFIEAGMNAFLALERLHTILSPEAERVCSLALVK
jgi:hypothetical protein